MFGLGWTARPTFFYDVQNGQFVTEILDSFGSCQLCLGLLPRNRFIGRNLVLSVH
jgi:hypothetical protein